jgi:thiol peroxidase
LKKKINTTAILTNNHNHQHNNALSTVTFRGTPYEVKGNKLQIGDTLPNATLLLPDLTSIELSKYDGSVRLVSTLPSIDTGICDAQIRRFSQETLKLGAMVNSLMISADLPFTQKRWLSETQINNVILLSDHRSMEFAKITGTYVADLRLFQRCVMVVNKHNLVVYCEFVNDISHHPDYDAALNALKDVLNTVENH